MPSERFFKALQSIRIEHLDMQKLRADPLQPSFDSWIPPFIKSNPPVKHITLSIDSLFSFIYPLSMILEAMSMNSRLEVCLFSSIGTKRSLS